MCSLRFACSRCALCYFSWILTRVPVSHPLLREDIYLCVSVFGVPPQQQTIAIEIHLRHRTRQINSIRSCHSYSMFFKMLSISESLPLSQSPMSSEVQISFFVGFETFSYLRLSSSGLFFIQSFRLIHMQLSIGGVITISSGTDRKRKEG